MDQPLYIVDPEPGDELAVQWNRQVDISRCLQENGYLDTPARPNAAHERRVQLVGALYDGIAGGKTTAKLLHWDGDDWTPRSPERTIDVYPEIGQRGYFFVGDKLIVKLCTANRRYYPTTSGAYYCEGVAAADISKGATGDITVGALTIAARATFGDTASGNAVGLGWDDLDAEWKIGDEECDA